MAQDGRPAIGGGAGGTGNPEASARDRGKRQGAPAEPEPVFPPAAILPTPAIPAARAAPAAAPARPTAGRPAASARWAAPGGTGGSIKAPRHRRRRLISPRRAAIVGAGEGRRRIMFSRKPKPAGPAAKSAKAGPNGLSFFGPEVVVNGDVATTANLHVDGRIDGHVRCAQLCQGASGTIAGDIVADEARIGGTVEGTVSARTLVVEASARIAGDVTYETLSIAAGAQIDGRLARRAALAGGAESPTMLIATSAEAAAAKAPEGDALFPLAAPKRAAAG